MKKTTLILALLLITGTANASTLSRGLALEANVSGNVDVGSSYDENANASENSSLEAEMTSDTDVEEDNSSSASGKSSIQFSINGSEARALENTDLRVSSSNMVSSDSDLKTYATVIAHNNESVSEVESVDNTRSGFPRGLPRDPCRKV